MSAAHELAPVTITLWEGTTATQGHRLVGSWDDVLDLPEWANPAVLEDKNHGRGWSPVAFAGDRRLKEAVESVYALVLDYEAPADQLPTTPEDGAALWGQWSGWVYTTWSHTPERPRFRLVVLLSRPVTAAEYPLLWRWAATRCEVAGHYIDEACRDASRLWYLPAVRPGHLHEYRLFPLHGATNLDVDAALAEQRAKESPPPPQPRRKPYAAVTTRENGASRYCRKALDGALEDIRLAPKGTRHNTIRVKAYHLAGLIHTGAISADEIERELMAEVERAGWDQLDKTRVTVRYQIKAGERAPKDLQEMTSATAPPSSSHASVEIVSEDWKGLLIRRKGEITSDLANAVAFLEHDDYWHGRLRYNEARQQIEVNDGDAWRIWQDHDDTDGAVWFQRARGLRIRPDAVCQAVQAVARRQSVNPLTDHLASLVWEGTPRLDTWLTSYAEAADSPYMRAAGACWLRSAVARAFQPGIKVDAALVLEGIQGAGKSSVFRVIGGEYFTDDIHDLGSKDAAVAMASAWIVELPELSAMNRTDLETLKAACSRQVDRYRPPYGRAMVSQPRRCVFGGTTNRGEYLRDETGNRRWLPVKVGKVNLDALYRDRDQLLAEAIQSWRIGVGVELPREVWAAAAEEQAARVESDPWEDKVAELCKGEKSVTVVRILTVGLGLELGKITQREQNRVARCLVRLGWERYQDRLGGSRSWAYRPCHQSPPSGDK